MSLTAAADAVELDRLATRLEDGAHELERVYAPVRRALHGSAWQGTDADAFSTEWDGPAKARLTSCVDALRGMATSLHTNVEEQRKASGVMGAASATATGVGLGIDGRVNEPGYLDSLEGLLDKLGLGKDAIELLLTQLRGADPTMMAQFADFLKNNGGLADLFSSLGKGLDLANVIFDFATDWIANAALPMDERILHAALVGGGAFLVGQGLSAVTKALGSVVGTAIGGPVGTAVGGLTGLAAGMALQATFDYLNDEYGVLDNVADQALDIYRDAKNVGGEIIDTVGDAVGSAVDGAENLYNVGKDIVGYVGGDLKDATSFWSPFW